MSILIYAMQYNVIYCLLKFASCSSSYMKDEKSNNKT